MFCDLQIQVKDSQDKNLLISCSLQLLKYLLNLVKSQTK